MNEHGIVERILGGFERCQEWCSSTTQCSQEAKWKRGPNRMCTRHAAIRLKYGFHPWQHIRLGVWATNVVDLRRLAKL